MEDDYGDDRQRPQAINIWAILRMVTQVPRERPDRSPFRPGPAGFGRPLIVDNVGDRRQLQTLGLGFCTRSFDKVARIRA